MQHVQEERGPTQSVSGNTVVQQEKDKLLQEKEHDKKDDKLIQEFQENSHEEDAVIVSMQQEIQQLQQLTMEKDHVIDVRKKQLRELNQQLAASEQVTAHLQQTLRQREKTIQKLQKENQHLRRELDKVLQQSLVTEKGKEQQTLKWKTCNEAPHQMSRGSATVCNNIAYFRPDDSRQVYSYNSDAEEWSTLPGCPTHNFTLTVVSGHVTAVGGMHNTLPFKLTSTLLSLVEEGGRKHWMEVFPRMPTKRQLTAVVCSGKTLVVAGGKGEWRTKLATVEVMNTDTLQWSTASSLPQPLSAAVATVCRDSIYLVAGRHQRRTAESVLTCSLSDLQSYSSYQIWRPIADLPVEHSTLITLNGQLLAVGGQDYQNKTNNIYSYNRETNSWEVISHMTTPRYQCLVAVLLHNELMVVGGWTTSGDTDKIEIASVEISSKYVVSQHIICYSEL